MTKLFKYILLVAMVLAFSGCFSFGGDEDAQTTEEGFTTYKTANFSVDVPSAWDVLNQDEFTSDVPDVTVVVFRNNVKNETFTANVNIVAKQIQEAVSSDEYAKLVVNRQSSGLVDYSEISKDSAKVMIGGSEADTLLTKFEARKDVDDNLVRYIQTYGVKGNTAFIVTGAISPQESESVVQLVEKVVKSFALT